ncbi:AraC family transcriptional regulator [Paenibacillus cisolokensis]|uniref:helix-turn-helix domain-containing protein n=1 Tax=Paenibacillus cisolokensis TaxID=1658519 RepID=UPI003D2D297F
MLNGGASAIRTGKAGFNHCYVDRAYTLTHLLLHQVQDRCCYEADGRLADHGSLLVYMLSGHGAIAIDGHELPLPERHYIWLNPGSSYRIAAAKGSRSPMRFVSLELQPTARGRHLLDALAQAGDGRAVRDVAGLDELLFEIMHELRTEPPHLPLMLDSLLNRLLIMLERQLSGSRAAADERKKAYGKKELVYQIVQYLDRHAAEISELGQLADKLGYSYSYMSHAFREEVGISLQEYWAKRRMMKAMNSLQSGRSSITQISELLHYQSVHSFSKAFKKMTGFTPTEYQSLYGRNGEYE